MSKKNVCIIFGGNSTEHDVSCKSVITFINNISYDKYNVYLVGITKSGEWVYYRGDTAQILSGEWVNHDGNIPCVLSPSSEHHGLILLGDTPKVVGIDVVIPVLHGKNGEDGTIQGLFELVGIPYVGCGVTASAVSMDKAYTKIIVDSIGDIRQAEYVLVRRSDTGTDYVQKAEQMLGYPMFVKPCKSGSSQGVSKAVDRDSLLSAVDNALVHDSKVLIEKAIVGRELECAVLKKSDGTLLASDVGEIVAGDVFYSYDAKYNCAESKTDTSPVLPDRANDRIKDCALRIFTALGCDGLSRVDFFLEESSGEVVFNEINTLPGFTPISMYPMLMNKSGLPLPELIDTLIESAATDK